MLNEVIVLFNGYSRMAEDDPTVMFCNSSCTLIKSAEGQRILVDTMTPWHRDELVSALKSHNVKCSDITHLVCTHGHSDHVGNNNLFLNAQQIVGHDISHQDRFKIHDSFTNGKPFPLTDDLEVVATAGHTAKCVSVVVRNCSEGVVVIAGDLFEKYEDIENEDTWLGAGSENPCVQRSNRLRMAQLADVIVPGHGAPFNVTEAIRKKLQSDVAKVVVQ